MSFRGKTFTTVSHLNAILLISSETLGHCLVLDQAIQVTEYDECSYQEMMALLPLMSHPSPKRVLIVGGGDGGIAREVVKHPAVESVVVCEIDEAVVRVSKQFLPFTSCSFADPRVQLKIEDGIEFVKKCESEFDVIITDSSDPIGPGVGLFNRQYYESLHRALAPGGIICSQAEGFWFEMEIVKKLYKMCKSIFASTSYASILVASYPAGQIGCMIASKDRVIDFSRPVTKLDPDHEDSQRYYTSEMHAAAFALPKQVSQVCELMVVFEGIC